MTADDDDAKTSPELTEKLNELESLVGQSPAGGDKPEEDIEIPILDELVTPEDYREPVETGPQADDEDEIDEIAERVEQKLSTELDEIVRLLKGNLKDSIMHELHDHRQKDPGKDTKD